MSPERTASKPVSRKDGLKTCLERKKDGRMKLQFHNWYVLYAQVLHSSS